MTGSASKKRRSEDWFREKWGGSLLPMIVPVNNATYAKSLLINYIRA